MNTSTFILFGFSHIFTLIFVFFFIILLIITIKLINKSSISNIVAIILGLLLLSSQIIKIVYSNYYGKLTLPMHLCDWAAITVVLTLILKNKLLFEISYYWGLGGTIQALLTPDLNFDFPHAAFFVFFIMHAGIIIGIFYLIFIFKMFPSKGSIKRVFFISQIYLIVALLVNYIFGKNYGFLSHKPSNSTLLDYFGPWPYYIISIEICGLIIFILLYYIYCIFNCFFKNFAKK